MMWRICYQYRQYLLALSLLAGILPVTQAADDPTETFLYEQVRLGNSKSNDVLVFSITVSFITYKTERS